MESERTDAHLIAASLDDPELFGDVFVRHRTEIFRYLSRRVGPDDAAELTGEVFARAFAIRHRYDGSWESARPWLYAIAQRIVGDYLRRSNVRRRESRVAVRFVERDLDPAADIVDAMFYSDQRRIIDAALLKLNAKDREVLMLSALSQLSLVEVAAAVAVPLGTVKSRLSRARSQLKAALPEELRDGLGSGT